MVPQAAVTFTLSQLRDWPGPPPHSALLLPKMVLQRALPPPLHLFKAQTQFFSKSAPVKPAYYDKKGTKSGLVLGSAPGPRVVAVVWKLVLALQTSKLSEPSLPGPVREGREKKKRREG